MEREHNRFVESDFTSDEWDQIEQNYRVLLTRRDLFSESDHLKAAFASELAALDSIETRDKAERETGLEEQPMGPGDPIEKTTLMRFCVNYLNDLWGSVLGESGDGQIWLTPDQIAALEEAGLPYQYTSSDPMWQKLVKNQALRLFDAKEKPNFPHSLVAKTVTTVCPSENTITLAICGDVGIGRTYHWFDDIMQQFKKIDETLMARPNTSHFSVHLGDVYYSGTPLEMNDNFLDLWPNFEDRSRSLNSNHEMYDYGYISILLENERFVGQNGISYFVIENDHWLIIGLDSAFFATQSYMTANLGTVQETFFKKLFKSKRDTKKSVLFMSHHCPVNNAGLMTEFGKTVMSLLDTSGYAQGKNILWYYGHTHAAVVYHLTEYKYQSREREILYTFLPRMCGHGGIPWADATKVYGPEVNSNVKWFENSPYKQGQSFASSRGKLADDQVVNGFAFVALYPNGDFAECFYDSDGNRTYTSLATFDYGNL